MRCRFVGHAVAALHAPNSLCAVLSVPIHQAPPVVMSMSTGPIVLIPLKPPLVLTHRQLLLATAVHHRTPVVAVTITRLQAHGRVLDHRRLELSVATIVATALTALPSRRRQHRPLCTARQMCRFASLTVVHNRETRRHPAVSTASVRPRARQIVGRRHRSHYRYP
jgi:hypothetical protein